MRLKTLLMLLDDYMHRQKLGMQLGVIYLYYTGFNGDIEIKNIEL